MRQLDTALAEAKGLPYDAQGVIVTAIEPDSPADQMGLRVDDVILSLNDAPMDTAKVFRDTHRNRARTWQIILQRGGTDVMRSIVERLKVRSGGHRRSSMVPSPCGEAEVADESSCRE